MYDFLGYLGFIPTTIATGLNFYGSEKQHELSL